MHRVARSVEIQQRFVADAAHELRSPLTALSLQAEGLEASDMPIETKVRCEQIT
ncbi:histidine kinase dimerization/phospho-acceptor domain-containing protein [uncultured Tolumonas sp.]|uniref:histidine kinase dimerization/phospho-acceptor domain-containing protein n=1 Tax=uncultured Tolumonas sp. TaxID=263765 RepID=UPI0037486196